MGIIDSDSNQRWMIEATPDFPAQLEKLNQLYPTIKTPAEKTIPLSNYLGLNGIFITHGHIGHYTGLMYLGRESIGAKGVPVYTMPRMTTFLKNNGTWSQLVNLNNIALKPLIENQPVKLNTRISITPFLVPHRDEYSETVGFKIVGPNKTIVFIPDIDKWEKWDKNIEELIKDCDIAYLDGTFFDVEELPGRNINEIPHPFVSESIKRLNILSAKEKAKVHFIHFNHTNPLINNDNEAVKKVKSAGFNIAIEGEKITF